MTKNFGSADIKKILVEQRKEYQKYLGVTAEHFESQVAFVAEILSDTRKILSKHTKILSEHTKQLNAITEMVAQNTVDIAQLKIDVEQMKQELQIIRGDLKQKADREELLLIERRVARLEHAAAH